MGICNLQVKTDLKNKSYVTDRACKQGDTLILEFNIFDNSVMADLTGFACDLRANKSDGKGYQIINNVTVTVSTGKATIKCPSSLTQFAGLLKLELTFTDTINNLQKTTFDINIQVDKSVIGNDDGSAPTVIITALEELNTNLAQISSKVSEAKAINNTLTNTKDAANALNNTLVANTATANNANSTLQATTGEAKETIEDLKQANSAYTEHIHNMDIHVTKPEKDKWNAYEARIIELTNIIDNYVYLDAYVVDDTGDNVVDDTGNMIIV